MVHPLDGVQAKLDRAFEHGQTFRDQVAALVKEDYYDTTQLERPKPGGVIELKGYLRVLKEPPLKLGVIAGDCAHNLRGALDHLVYQIALRDSKGSPPNDTQFPIARSPSDYLRPGKHGVTYRDHCLAGIAGEHRALFDTAQPYVETPNDIEGHFLTVLNAFSNIDKHRLIQTVAVRPQKVEAQAVDGTCAFDLWVPPKAPIVIRNGAHIYTLTISQPSSPQVKVNVLFTYMVGCGDRGVTDADLLNMCVFVGRLVDRFRPLFT